LIIQVLKHENQSDVVSVNESIYSRTEEIETWLEINQKYIFFNFLVKSIADLEVLLGTLELMLTKDSS
jgi:hypothetical protein